jgi:hypothetical protein
LKGAEKEVGDHGKIPSYRWRNEGILPGFAGDRISRKIEVQDPTCKVKKVKGLLTVLMVALGRLIKGTYRIVAQKTYRERVLASTGRDPLRCVRCGGEMMLWQVWHPRYGLVYDELQAIKRGRYGPCRGSPSGAGADGDGTKALTQLALADLGV